MNGERATQRTILIVSGGDRIKFLQGMVTNDIERLKGQLIYTALLTPQGKYLVDFFVLEQGDTVLLDVDSGFADSLLQRLTLYKLRADVSIEKSTLNVVRGTGAEPEGAFADPRNKALGWRAYGYETGQKPSIDWDAIRVEHCIPKTGVELIPNDTFILEAGFERLCGVDFKKGCYVGQEVTARMKHKTQLRKGLAAVVVEGFAPVATPIVANGKPLGTLFTQANGHGIAYLRFDRATQQMTAGKAVVGLKNPPIDETS